MPREPVAFTKIAFDDGLYELSWKAPISGEHEVNNYTIFWCENDRDRPYQCQVSNCNIERVGLLILVLHNFDTFNMIISKIYNEFFFFFLLLSRVILNGCMYRKQNSFTT